MSLLENVKEGLRSVKANLLRSAITMMIVVLGITALVGIFTAVGAIEESVNKSLSTLGVNTFDISSKTNRGQNTQGVIQKTYPQIRMTEAFRFIDEFQVASTVSLYSYLTQIAEVKRLPKR